MISQLFIFFNLLSIFFAGPPDASLQKAKEDFTKINKLFKSQNISMMMVYNFYELHDTYTPVETQTGLYYKKGDKDYSKIMNIETLHTPELTVVAENNDKIMLVTGPVSERVPISTDLETLLKFCKEINIREVQGDERIYDLGFDEESEGEFKKIQVVLNTKTNYLTKLVLYYNKIDKMQDNGEATTIYPKVEIVYWNYNKVVVNESKVLSQSTYIQPMGSNKFKCSSAFSNYQMYNQKIK